MKYKGLDVKIVSSEPKEKKATKKTKNRGKVGTVLLFLAVVFLVGVAFCLRYIPYVHMACDQITSTFAPSGRSRSITPPPQIANLDFVLPVENAEDIRNDNGRIIFDIASQLVTVKAASSGKVSKIEEQRAGRFLTINLGQNFTLRYYYLSICGVVVGQQLEQGQVVGIATGNLTLELFRGKEQILLMYSQGRIVVG